MKTVAPKRQCKGDRECPRPATRRSEFCVEHNRLDGCPGCGRYPGQGVSEHCFDPEGCGYFKGLPQ